MKLIISIVGKSNVGKSTLFNRIICSNKSLVNKKPYSTIDRIYGINKIGKKKFLIIDTGSFYPNTKIKFLYNISLQVKKAINKSKIVIFLLDGLKEIDINDEEILIFLKKQNSLIIPVINKIEKLNNQLININFYKLGLNNPCIISAINNIGIKYLVKKIIKLSKLKKNFLKNNFKNIKIGILGYENSGKSTLINSLIKKKRIITSELPGTTKNPICVNFNYKNKNYIFTDTAGINKIKDKYKVKIIKKNLEIIKSLNIIIFLISIDQDINKSIINIINYIIKFGKSLIICINKSDLLLKKNFKYIKKKLKKKFFFLPFIIKIYFISALNSKGLKFLLKEINKIYKLSNIKFKTYKLNTLLKKAIKKYKLPSKNIKLKFIKQTNKNPITIKIWGKFLNKLRNNYKKYLEKFFIKNLLLISTPLKVEFNNK